MNLFLIYTKYFGASPSQGHLPGSEISVENRVVVEGV